MVWGLFFRQKTVLSLWIGSKRYLNIKEHITLIPIEIWLSDQWELFLQLNPLTCLFLFIIYGILFEALYIKFLSSFRDYKRFPASIISVTLYFINLWGLNESLNENIYYCVPVAFGTFAGTFLQMTIDKRKRERKGKTDGGTSCESV